MTHNLWLIGYDEFRSKFSTLYWNKQFCFFLVDLFKCIPVWFCLWTIFSINQIAAWSFFHLLVLYIELISGIRINTFRTRSIFCYTGSWITSWLNWCCSGWCINICMVFLWLFMIETKLQSHWWQLLDVGDQPKELKHR